MAGGYVGPWEKALSGPWREAFELAAEPCNYGCGKLATMPEPGKPGKAHKVCAEGTAGDLTPVTGWDEDRESKAVPRAVGCGTSTEQTSGRVCAGTGASPSCKLCPNSPTYWRLPENSPAYAEVPPARFGRD